MESRATHLPKKPRSRVTQRTAAGSRSSDTEGDLLFFSDVKVLQEGTKEDQSFVGQVKAPPQKRRAVIRVESVETQDHVSALPLTSCMEQLVEELSFVPECCQRAAGPAHVR